MNAQGISLLAGAVAAVSHSHAALLAGSTTRAANSPGSALALLIGTGWGILAIGICWLLGVFRRRSIVGPERLVPDESSWWLLMIPCIGLLIAQEVVKRVHPAPLKLSAEATTLLTGDIFEAIVVAAIVILSMAFRRNAIRLMGLRPRKIPAGLAGGLLLIFIVYPLVFLSSELVVRFYDWFQLNQPQAHEVLRMLNRTNDRRVVIIGTVTAACIAPMFEELLFRGLLQTMLSRMFNVAFGMQLNPGHKEIPNPAAPGDSGAPCPAAVTSPMVSPPPATTGPPARWAAVLMTSAAFAASHGQPAWLVPLFVLSVGLGYVYERTGNLWMNIAAHGIFNTAQILLFLHP